MADPEDTEYSSEFIDRDRSISGDVLVLDDVFDAVSHPRRRYLLYTLLDEGNETTVSQLATRIAAWENDVPVTEVPEELHESVSISLHHCHIPHLASLDVIDYRAEDELIVSATNTDQVQAVLAGVGASLDAQQESHARSDQHE